MGEARGGQFFKSLPSEQLKNIEEFFYQSKKNTRKEGREKVKGERARKGEKKKKNKEKGN